MTDRHLEAGAAVAARLNPTLHEALSARYDGLLPGMADRVSYVISPAGKVIHVYQSMSPDRHVEETLGAVQRWKQGGG